MSTDEKLPQPPPRGIPNNVSGVACHLTSALHLLLHAISPLRAALLEIASYNNNDTTTIVQTLANLASSLFQNNVVINPLPLYQALEQSSTLDPHELGDAAKALRVLLHTLLQDDDESLLKPILQHYIMGATLEQTLVGECVFHKQTFSRIQKKTKLVPCPFSIALLANKESTTSLQEALLDATIVPQHVLGVDWNQISNYRQEPEDGDVPANDSECWTTTKTMCFASLPHYLLIHLQRAHYQDDAVQLSTRELRVDRQLNMEPYVTNALRLQQEQPRCCLAYQLVGAILHVSEDTTKEEEQENGHYVTLVQSQHGGQEWYLFNDDDVTLISNEQQVLDLMSGCPNEHVDGLYCATVLAYCQTCHCSNATTNQTLMNDLRDSLQQQSQQETTNTASLEPAVDWNEPLQLVGRRLRIKWKSGKYYSGIISSYNDESGKHCITYKDGDVRHYTLRKKTIEWIS